MKVTLRRAISADAPAIARAHVASWQEAYPGIVPASHLQGFTIERTTERLRQSLASGAEETYVAEHDGEILGFLTLGDCRDTDVDQQTTGEIWGIYLSPEYWRKGIGRFLSEQGEAMLVSRGRSFATLWVLDANAQARRFYEAMGFELDGVTKQVSLGASLKAIRYCKKLKDAEQRVGGDA
jgi:ribosomal protein S18 acetylase RimI-like enzyme